MTGRAWRPLGSASLHARAVCLLCVSSACSPDTTAERAEAAVVPPEEVVARVDGVPITRADVRGLLSANPMPRREALRLLIDAEVLAQHAARRGYVGLPEVQREARAAAVRTLLSHTVAGADTVAVQHARYLELVTELEHRTSVQIDEEAVARALADPAIWRAVQP